MSVRANGHSPLHLFAHLFGLERIDVRAVEFHEGFTPGVPLVELGRVGQARKFAVEVEFVFGAIGGMVENGVGVVEDDEFGDSGVVVVGLELG